MTPTYLRNYKLNVMVGKRIIQNNGAGNLYVTINDIPESKFTMGAGESQIFNKGDLAIKTIEFETHTAGGIPTYLMLSVER